MGKIELMAVAIIATACDADDMAGLPKQTVAIPLTGGLDTKTGPLAQVPGSFLSLDDVRQERAHEWKNRQPITHADALDDLGSAPPLRTVELPGGGLFGLTVSGANFSAAVTYSRNVPSGIARWQQTVGVSSAVTPSAWQRSPIATDINPVYKTAVAVGNGLRFVAWKPGDTGAPSESAIKIEIVSDTDGKSVLPATSFGATSGSNPKVVHYPAGNLFVLFWSEGANIKAASWSSLTGAAATGATILKSNAVAVTKLDAIYYVGTNITVVYESTTGPSNVRYLGVVPATFALTIDVDLGVTCGNALSLFPDPDASGISFVGVITSALDVRVLRVNSLGAIQSNDLIEATGGNQIIGCAYQSGAGWMAIYRWNTVSQPTIRAAKKRSGVVSSPVSIAIHPNYVLDSNGWREPGTDPMRYMLGVHVGDLFASQGDYQHSYFEMAIEYENAVSTISNSYTEPQARLLPLNAGPGSLPAWGANNNPTQVVRTGTNTFVLALSRLAAPFISAGLRADIYAVDTWKQTIMSTATIGASHPNLGNGIVGSQASYLPAGLLLQSVNGGSIWGHGGSVLPFRPTTNISAGASGPTAGQAYQYVGSIDYPDEGGNVWRSARSVASAAVTPTAGNRQIDVTWRLPTLEHASRPRTARLWRTFGNGDLANAKLVYQTTILSGVTTHTVTFADTVSDATLATSNSLPIGLAASITPAFNHVAFFDGRMWGAERDYPRRLRFTQVNQTGISPEYPVEFFVDIDDEEGDITGLSALDDKLIVYKNSAVYFIPQGGPALDGSGATYAATKISSDVGCELGTPTISIGSESWFFHQGMYKIDRSLHIEFVGEGIDAYFNQPLINSREPALSLTYNRTHDEMRLLTSSYRFVYDRVHSCWIRDTGALAGTLYTQSVADLGDMFFRTNGQVWWDYDEDNFGGTEPTGTIRGIIRSPWIRAAQPEGYFRIYRARTLWARKDDDPDPPSSSPETTIYFNDDDTILSTYTPTTTTGIFKQTIEARAARGKCASFSLQTRLPADDVTWRINQWSVLLAPKKGMHADSRAKLGRV